MSIATGLPNPAFFWALPAQPYTGNERERENQFNLANCNILFRRCASMHMAPKMRNEPSSIRKPMQRALLNMISFCYGSAPRMRVNKSRYQASISTFSACVSAARPKMS